jgi:uncharacterized protein YndB with AHSA1/START domain
MTPRPTARIDGDDLILTRRFRAPIDDVWTSVTDPEHTARWFGPWEGEAGPGKTIRVQMMFEEGKPWTSARIERCEAPRHLALTTQDDHGAWSLELTLVQKGDTTEMTFVHHLSDRKLAEHAGPGWEYYLDNLVAARAGETLPRFDQYYPAQCAYFLEQASG